MPNLVIKPMSESDVDEVYFLETSLISLPSKTSSPDPNFPPFTPSSTNANLDQSVLVPSNTSSSKQKILDTLSSDTLFYYVLKLDSEIVGFFEVSVVPPELELYDIAVKTEYQRRGYSTFMLNFIISECKSRHIRTIFLEVNSINIKAINLYKKFGFETYATRKNYYGENDAILMKLEI